QVPRRTSSSTSAGLSALAWCAFNHNMAKTATIWLNASHCHDMVEKPRASLPVWNRQEDNGLACFPTLRCRVAGDVPAEVDWLVNDPPHLFNHNVAGFLTRMAVESETIGPCQYQAIARAQNGLTAPLCLLL